MAPPLYFFAKTQAARLAPAGKLARSLLASRGLDQVLADVEGPEHCVVDEIMGAGPGGQSGTILSAMPVAGPVPVRIGYYPEFQTWQEVGENLWMGLDKEYPPTPEDLARRAQFDGYRINGWLVPVLRDPKGGTHLPSRWRYQGDEVVEEVRLEYLGLWQRWAEVAGLFFDADAPEAETMPLTRRVDLCLEVLGLNYRVGRFEQNLLDVVEPDNWISILMASVDLPGFRDVFEQVTKKKTSLSGPAIGSEVSPPSSPAEPAPPASPATSPGSEASCPATVPATASSSSSPSAQGSPTPRPSTTTSPAT
jgi:hypothetical protein